MLHHKFTVVYMKILKLQKCRYMHYYIFLPLLFLVPFFLAIVISCWILLSKYSCFFVNIASVSLSLLMASWGDGPDRDLCLDLELDPELELGLEDELDELPLNNFEILLIFISTLIPAPGFNRLVDTRSREKVTIPDRLLFRFNSKHTDSSWNVTPVCAWRCCLWSHAH